MFEGEWWVACSQETFRAVSRRPDFRQIVALGRILNGLRFVRGAAVRFAGENTPEAMRQRMNSTFFMGSLIFEGMILVRRMSQHFRNNQAFEIWMKPLLRDRELDAFLKARLKPLRNLAVFHAEDKHLREQLERITNRTVVFQSARGTTVGASNYELADITAMQTVVGSVRSTDEFQEGVMAVTNKTIDYADKFEAAGDNLIALWLRDAGFDRRAAVPGEGFWPADPT
jgi:hypothetical protein